MQRRVGSTHDPIKSLCLQYVLSGETSIGIVGPTTKKNNVELDDLVTISYKKSTKPLQ